MAEPSPSYVGTCGSDDEPSPSYGGAYIDHRLLQERHRKRSYIDHRLRSDWGCVRSFYIYKADVEEHGLTPGCPGCRAMSLRANRQCHDDACRLRFEGILKQIEEGKKRLDRADARQSRCKADALDAMYIVSSDEEGHSGSSIVLREEIRWGWGRKPCTCNHKIGHFCDGCHERAMDCWQL